MRLRYNCTLMSCWRTLHLYACWVRHALPPLYSWARLCLSSFPQGQLSFLHVDHGHHVSDIYLCLSVQKSVVTDMGTAKQMVSYSSHNLFQGSSFPTYMRAALFSVFWLLQSNGCVVVYLYHFHCISIMVCLLAICISFFFFFFVQATLTSGILVLWPGIEPGPMIVNV